jgi:hypothetical protein
MNLTLKRDQYRKDGIYGRLLNDKDEQVAVTLEHAYDPNDEGSFAPKVPQGTYTCQRGQHQLAGMSAPFTTFEITGVPGHTGILFHRGNYNSDSEGCVLLGRDIATSNLDGTQMLTLSAITFTSFMCMLNGVDQFTLTVS